MLHKGTAAVKSGLSFEPYFAFTGTITDVSMVRRDLEIKDHQTGQEVFRQEGFECPITWSDTAATIFASKFAFGKGEDRENSVLEIVNRVVNSIANYGHQAGYFKDIQSRYAFQDDLTYLLVHQYGSFNSPVWFNVGIFESTGLAGTGKCYYYDDQYSRTSIGRDDLPSNEVRQSHESYVHPQASACFIQSVEDTMESIMELATSEAILFKHGSGTGTDLSPLRSKREFLSTGGKPSGPVSFAKIYDRIASTIKSGGKCLAYGQLVFTDEGSRTALELAQTGERFKVLSYSRRLGRVATKEAHAWFSETKPGVEVITDKGTFHTSADHPFMLSHGFPCEAQKLQPGQRLLPITLQRDRLVDYVDAIEKNTPTVQNVIHLGDIKTVSVEVFDEEEDDKRAWSEHNFAIAPFGGSALDCSVAVYNTRRAAKMNTLRVDHPDILEFINCKAIEESKKEALVAAGFSNGMEGEASTTVAFQNVNFSVRVTDEFMHRARDGETYELVSVTEPKVYWTEEADLVLASIAEATHKCGDPGLQFVDTINRWHTCPVTGPINCSNPCSEFVFLDESACNLASLRLTKFQYEDGSLNVEAFKHAVRIFITAQDILVGLAGYPTRKICENSIAYRPLGLGYCDLGAYLMSAGLPYNSPEGQRTAANITALMTAQAYYTSAELAQTLGAFEGHAKNEESMRWVLHMHLGYMSEDGYEDDALAHKAAEIMMDAIAKSNTHGMRNAQVTLIAPTGTIALTMDCDTTGVEPAFSLVSHKVLAGGGAITHALGCVEPALRRLGYKDWEIDNICDYLESKGTLKGCHDLRIRDIAVFETAIGDWVVSPEGHVLMMAAVQPFLSGAISKTVNVPSEYDADDIAEIYYRAWKEGVKCIAVYRDGSKGDQPLSNNVVCVDDDAYEEERDGDSCQNCGTSLDVAKFAGTCLICPNCGTSTGGC